MTSATPSQIETIISLYRSEGWWTEPSDGPKMVRGIVTGSHLFMIAEAGEEIIGMGRVISDGASDAYIQDVTVTKAYRGKGIGSSIIQRLLLALKKTGLEWVGLVAENNSRGFYEKLGFVAMKDAVPMLKKAP